MNDFGEAGSAFGPGPWEDEPGRAEWYAHGLPCLARRNSFGAWCGYVAVPPGHPFHGADYDDDDVDVGVHGGLTYAGLCDGAEGTGICHVPRPGEPAEVWWFGFDCGHCFDVMPARPDLAIPGGLSAYRDLAYVTAQTEDLAEQLAAKGGRR